MAGDEGRVVLPCGTRRTPSVYRVGTDGHVNPMGRRAVATCVRFTLPRRRHGRLAAIGRKNVFSACAERYMPGTVRRTRLYFAWPNRRLCLRAETRNSRAFNEQPKYCTVQTNAARHASQQGHPRRLETHVTHHRSPRHSRQTYHKSRKSPKMTENALKIPKRRRLRRNRLFSSGMSCGYALDPLESNFAAWRGVADPAPHRTMLPVMRHTPSRRAALGI